MSFSEKPTCSKLISSKSVNDKIIDYYLKYAADRDIEKFMRFSSSCPSKSSSDENEYVIALEVPDKNTCSKQKCDQSSDTIGLENLTIHSKSQTPENDVEIIQQAPDSITKIDKKLEWDSLGDVGYKKAKSTGNISSLERSLLKELFNESPSEPNISQNHANLGKSSSNISLKSDRREKWRQTLENLGKKYSSVSASLNTQDFIEQPQSTPKVVPNTEKSCQTNLEEQKFQSRTKHIDHSCQTSFARPNSQRIERCSQTSAASIRSAEVQANLSSRAESFTTQSSFEYHAGENESQNLSTRSILKEKNLKASTLRSKASSSCSDKENQSSRKQQKSKCEVDLGIKLLCSLIDAKNLSGSQKKNLAKKIFAKIIKQQSSASLSSSQSSAVSIRSLIDSSQLREGEKSHDESPDSMNVKQTTEEETQTDDLKADEKPPTPTSSLEEPVTMREWLHPLTRSEKDYDKKQRKRSSQSLSPQASERQKQLSYIEKEIIRLEGLKNLLLNECPPRTGIESSTSTTKSSNKTDVIYEESADIHLQDRSKSTTQKSSKDIVIYDEANPGTAKKSDKADYKTTKDKANEEQKSSSSSLKNNRSKLETPISGSTSSSVERESVSAFAHQLQKQFMDNYSKKVGSASEHYSEPRICGKPVFARNPSYTSVASSAFCMSSEMSIPIVESSSTSTTTHQYDSHGCDSVGGVAVQTSYSIIKTDPIFGPRCRCICTCGKECKCSCPKPTVRVSGKIFHQTVQVKPKALAYVLRFSETPSKGSKKLAEEYLTLQERLQSKNPDFCSKADERRAVLKKLHALREERIERIREIAESSSVSSISRKLDELPPPPIKHVRIGPTKEMKQMTKKRYCQLPEVVAKQEREKLERRKKSTRLITNIFNKKLQRMVHNGKLSLEYSRTVI